MSSVAAVVVTRNRAKLLSRCITALLAQSRPVGSIYVVDNASSDGTQNYLAAQGLPVVPVLSQQNLGSGGGMALGMARAYEDGFEMLWCGDDDGYPAPDALERLLPAAGGVDPVWLNCMVVESENHAKLTWALRLNGSKTALVSEASGTAIIRGCVHPFNGTLLSRSVLERIGLPHAGLFIWGDEAEFNRRAESAGIMRATVTASRWYHPANNAAEPLSAIPVRSFWKHYYAIRNCNAYAVDIQRTHGCGAATVRLSGRDAVHAGRKYLRELLWDEIRRGLSGVPAFVKNLPKTAIVGRAVWAAIRNDQTPRYLPKPT